MAQSSSNASSLKKPTIKIKGIDFDYRKSMKELQASNDAYNAHLETTTPQLLDAINGQLREMKLETFQEMYACRSFRQRFVAVMNAYGDNSLAGLHSKVHNMEEISRKMDEDGGSGFRDAVVATAFALRRIFDLGKESMGTLILMVLTVLRENKDQIVNQLSQAAIRVIPQILARFTVSSNLSGTEVFKSVILDIFRAVLAK